MSTAFFRDPHVVADLLAVCQGEGWLNPKVVQKTRVLIEHGLHPEQALIGTALLTPDQYGEALTHIFDVPFARPVSSSRRSSRPTRIDIAWLATQRATIIDEGVAKLIVAFADPSDTDALKAVEHVVQAHGWELVPAVTLWSDIRPSQGVPLSTVGTARRQLEQTLEQASTSHIEMGNDAHGWHVTHESVQSLDGNVIKAASTSAPALLLHLHRHAQQSKSDWNLSHHRTSHGSILVLHREGNAVLESHPLRWSNILQAFTQSPQGMLVFVASTADVQAQREEYRWLEEGEAHWRTHTQVPALYQVEEEDAQEEAVHAALSGRPVVAHQKTADLRWLKPLQHAHIPVSILERHAVPNGMAWTSRSL